MRTLLHEIVEQGIDLADTTRKKYLQDLDVWVAFAGPDPQGWTRERARAFYQGLLERMKPQSANRLMASLRYAASWWAKREDDERLNFVVFQKAKTKGKTKKHALTDEQALQLLRSCDRANPRGLRDRALIVLGLETGIRRMSIASTLLEGIVWRPYPTISILTKGGELERVNVPLSNAAIMALEPWRAWLTREGIRVGPVFRGVDEAINQRNRLAFTASEHAMSTSAIYKMITGRAEALGFHAYPHIFRHTFVTWRSSAGYTPIQIAAMTGHKLGELGAMSGYLDMAAIGEQIRHSTPQWLTDYLNED